MLSFVMKSYWLMVNCSCGCRSCCCFFVHLTLWCVLRLCSRFCVWRLLSRWVGRLSFLMIMWLIGMVLCLRLTWGTVPCGWGVSGLPCRRLYGLMRCLMLVMKGWWLCSPWCLCFLLMWLVNVSGRRFAVMFRCGLKCRLRKGCGGRLRGSVLFLTVCWCRIVTAWCLRLTYVIVRCVRVLIVLRR